MYHVDMDSRNSKGTKVVVMWVSSPDRVVNQKRQSSEVTHANAMPKAK